MKKLLYSATWFAVDGGGNSAAKFQAGQAYAMHEDAAHHIALGIAQEVDVPDEAAADQTPAADTAPAT